MGEGASFIMTVLDFTLRVASLTDALCLETFAAKSDLQEKLLAEYWELFWKLFKLFDSIPFWKYILENLWNKNTAYEENETNNPTHPWTDVPLSSCLRGHTVQDQLSPKGPRKLAFIEDRSELLLSLKTKKQWTYLF